MTAAFGPASALNLGNVVNGRLRAERRRQELFRPGVVAFIDKTSMAAGEPWLATIFDGQTARPMPYLDVSLVVGDVVKWVDQTDPFCWAKADPDADGEYTGTVVTKRGPAFSATGDGFPGSGTFYDYDQGLTGLDSIALPPFSRIDPTSSVENYTGGIVLFDFASTPGSHTTDFLVTDLDGSDLTPASHPFWDGTIVPPLSNPVDEYVALGGNGGLSLRTHSDVGLADLPGFHSHAISIDRPVLSNSAGSQTVIREAESIQARNMATVLTTITPGSTIAWPAPISAPGANWLLLFIAHVKPIVDNPPPGLQDLFILPMDDFNDPYFPNWIGSGFSTTISKNGGMAIGFLRSWQAGSYAPFVELDATGPAREIAFSSMRCTFRDETV